MNLLEVTVRFFKIRSLDWTDDILLPIQEHAVCTNCDRQLTVKSTIEKSQEVEERRALLFCEKCECSEAIIIVKSEETADE